MLPEARRCYAPATVGDITELIKRAQAGEDAALDSLFEQLYEPLCGLARSRLTRGALKRCSTRPDWYTSSTFAWSRPAGCW